MAQFDVHSLPDETWVVVIQSDLAAVYRTKLVVPLIPPDEDAGAVTRLNPLLTVDGEPRLLATHLAGAPPKSLLGPRITSLESEELTIKSALDVLISGF